MGWRLKKQVELKRGGRSGEDTGIPFFIWPKLDRRFFKIDKKVADSRWAIRRCKQWTLSWGACMERQMFELWLGRLVRSRTFYWSIGV